MSADVMVLGAEEARDLTNRIRQTGSVLWALIVKAFDGRVWESLGYESWDAYCDAEFDGARLKLPREERREVVASLREAGMSTRAIAAATGMHHSTVADDVTAGVGNPTPQPPDPEFIERIQNGIEQSRNGDTVPLEEYLAEDPDDEIVDAEIVDDEPAPPPKPVTGLDGKTYPQKPRSPEMSTKVDKSRDAVRERVDKTRSLADSGYTSAQIAEQVGMTVNGLKNMCRERNIDVPADAIVGKGGATVDTDRVIEQSIGTLEGVAMGLALIEDVPSLDAEKRLQWLEAIREPLSAINRFRKELRS